MNLTWYLNRLKKMSPAEVLKRFSEQAGIYHSRFKYRDPARWPYSRFACDDIPLMLHSLPGIHIYNDWEHYRLYNMEFDLTKPLNWFFSDQEGGCWPACHYAGINYRPGNTNGDVRINWELNRLQFLPAMAVTDEDLVKSILADWLTKNAYLHGPAYLSSMEVALRWVSIYRAVCLFKKSPRPSLLQSLAGLAVASGRFIESRLSTHSSAGNHLIVEAVGLFWIGKAFQEEEIGRKWLKKARDILWKHSLIQLNPDGTSQEQSFWYLGFVLDALFHYLLLEDNKVIPKQVLDRIQKATEFVHEMISLDGSFPDYGDRDDGFVFRVNGTYKESPFPSLLGIGAFFFNRPDWFRDCHYANKRFEFWTGKKPSYPYGIETSSSQLVFFDKPQLRTYSDGGMTLMKWSKGRLLFRHSPLGMGKTCGHGHADALSVLFYWNNVPVLIDLGSGQYNGDQKIRDFFRSTIAHNTVEIGGENQAKSIGPFMWEKSYETCLTKAERTPSFFAEAYHTGYKNRFGIIHKRKCEWIAPYHMAIHDDFSGPGGLTCRGAFHLGNCGSVTNKENRVEADFNNFVFSIVFAPDFTVEVFHGSKHPFMGWRSTTYGAWEPIHSIVFSFDLSDGYHCKMILKIIERRH